MINQLWQIKKVIFNSFGCQMTSFYPGFLVRRQENAFYKLCKREIVLSNMGEGALTSHANEKKH